MYLDQWLAKRNARDSDPASTELLSKKRSLRVKVSEARRELNLRYNSQLDQRLEQLDNQLAEEIREVEDHMSRSFDRKLTRRAV